jgi:GNAT superfamily N-acetyltransferase
MEPATLKDIAEIWSLFKRTRAKMEEEGNFMWSHGYPTKGLFKEDVASSGAFVLREEGKIIAYIALSFSVFDDFFWESRSEEKAKGLYRFVNALDGEKPILLHRLMVDPSYAGKGVATGALTFLRERFKGYLMLFASSPANDKANRLYEKLGFVNDGPYPFEYGKGPWLLFHCHW